MYKIGILFDIDELEGGLYGWRAYQIFFGAVDTRQLAGCTLSDGDTNATLARRANQYCIAVESLDASKIATVKSALSRSNAKGLLPLPSRFVESTLVSQEPIVIAAHINAAGELVSCKIGWIMEAWRKSREGRQDSGSTAIPSSSMPIVMKNQFANEEWESSSGYSSGYSKPKNITEQIKLLRQLKQGIDLRPHFWPFRDYTDKKITEQPLPPGAEGWFAIPMWQSVGKTYEEALEKVLLLICKQRYGKFRHYFEALPGQKYLRRHERTAEKLNALCETQKGYDILVVAAQFGLRHRGRSVRRAREVFMVNEFGLGVFEVACMILTHPDRIADPKDLGIDCAGDEYNDPHEDDDFSSTLCFEFPHQFGGVHKGDELILFWRKINNVTSHKGSASAFFTQ